MFNGYSQCQAASRPRLFVNESFILQMGQHAVDGGGRDPEVTLQIGVCGRSAVDFGVVVDEGEILALLIGIGGDIFIRVRIDMVCIL